MKTLAALTLILAATVAQAQTPATAFQVTSSDVKNGAFAPAQIFNGFGCTGGNVSPHLSWRGAPQGTRSFVVTLYDPDAPTGSGFWHWVVINLPAAMESQATDGIPNHENCGQDDTSNQKHYVRCFW